MEGDVHKLGDNMPDLKTTWAPRIFHWKGVDLEANCNITVFSNAFVCLQM